MSEFNNALDLLQSCFYMHLICYKYTRDAPKWIRFE